MADIFRLREVSSSAQPTVYARDHPPAHASCILPWSSCRSNGRKPHSSIDRLPFARRWPRRDLVHPGSGFQMAFLLLVPRCGFLCFGFIFASFSKCVSCLDGTECSISSVPRFCWKFSNPMGQCYSCCAGWQEKSCIRNL